MKIASSFAELGKALSKYRANRKSIAFVPTMGALHAGHIALVNHAATLADVVVVSIFVNPMQFNNQEDLKKYPRTLEDDTKLLTEAGVALLFAPSAQEVYGDSFETKVSLPDISSSYEGASRPGHFDGVATVVTLLLSAVRPDYAVFGEKDFQQLLVIEHLTRDLRLGVKIVRSPTVREASGLAMSSRNRRLSEQGKLAAVSLSKAMQVMTSAYKAGEKRGAYLIQLGLDEFAKDRAKDISVELEYLAVVDDRSLEWAETAVDSSRILVAAWVEGVRLIDNSAIGKEQESQ
jgi:pantoate--beta-alanine ligase